MNKVNNCKKRNVIFILSDDQGMWALGAAGNPEIITPNLDRLAAEGMMFDNFFCASPVCSPARATLLTGRIPSQHGIHDWLKDENKKQEEIEYLKGIRGYTDYLHANGYQCALSGKWHLGNSACPQKGFTRWFCHKSGGGPYYNAPIYKEGKLYYEERYVTDAITEDALEFLEGTRQDVPFYLYVGYTAPHAPWLDNHPREYTDMYKDCPFSYIPKQERHPDSIYLTDEVARNERENLIGYYASVTAMDAGIGRIIDKVEKMGLREETLIIFSSDNGFSCGQHGFWGKGNGTFPINMYDSSVKVPFIASQPGIIPQNVRNDALLSAYDFMPTLLEYLDIAVEEEDKEGLPGRSFVKALYGEDFSGEEAVVILDEYGPNRMIRSKEWKYIRRYPYGPDEMYNLCSDPGETDNLLTRQQRPVMADKLLAELEEWFARYADARIDGAREGVYGSGQIHLAGVWSGKEASYSCDEYIKETPFYKMHQPR